MEMNGIAAVYLSLYCLYILDNACRKLTGASTSALSTEKDTVLNQSHHEMNLHQLLACAGRIAQVAIYLLEPRHLSGKNAQG